ncbi:hypothetical protein AAG570_000250, partial [Ranatra chinensis]
SRSASEVHDLISGHHHWQPTSHARPTYCNICRDALSGVTSHGLSCEVCKCKVHKRCVSKAINNCKWTTLASVGKDIIEDKHGVKPNYPIPVLYFLVQCFDLFYLYYIVYMAIK